MRAKVIQPYTVEQSKLTREVAKRTGYSINEVEEVVQGYQKVFMIATMIGKGIVFSGFGTVLPKVNFVQRVLIVIYKKAIKDGEVNDKNVEVLNKLKSTLPSLYREAKPKVEKKLNIIIKEDHSYERKD